RIRSSSCYLSCVSSREEIWSLGTASFGIAIAVSRRFLYQIFYAEYQHPVLLKNCIFRKKGESSRPRFKSISKLDQTSR
ncbi:MAG: hypothetical protein O6942_02465, partial [Bacteroidetes bacterium]|nr:hypothetical protein [Bacteroidota bacterium]